MLSLLTQTSFPLLKNRLAWISVYRWENSLLEWLKTRRADTRQLLSCHSSLHLWACCRADTSVLSWPVYPGSTGSRLPQASTAINERERERERKKEAMRIKKNQQGSEWRWNMRERVERETKREAGEWAAASIHLTTKRLHKLTHLSGRRLILGIRQQS